MNIKVNGREVEIFSGARVADVLRKYSRISWKQVQNGSKTVCDGLGHEIAHDGELNGGEALFVRMAGKRRAGK
ncbi:MAG: hypothetical protein MUC72_07550 [Acidobacteria bacterium]|jgi:hypothetical protein|nr:hypothetical protein [Acidobacteriota bacterium]